VQENHVLDESTYDIYRSLFASQAEDTHTTHNNTQMIKMMINDR